MHKKIIILLPNLRGGGAERLHLTLAKYWQAQGLSVTFLLMKKHGELLADVPEGIEIVDLAAPRIRDVIAPLVRYLRRVKPDVLITAMWPLTSVAVVAWWLSGKLGRLYLSDHNQLSLSCRLQLRLSPRIMGAIIRLTYPLATGVIAVSAGVKQDLCQVGGLAPSSIRVIYNPAALGIAAHRAVDSVRAECWGSGFDYHILAVGSLKIPKDHATLIRAFAQLPTTLRAKLIILGDGPLRAELNALIQQLNLQDSVALLGHVADPYLWYRSADLFVLSSRWEGFGNVIVEALECGVPVVSTDCGGPAEILDHGRVGRLVPIENYETLAAAIAQSLTEPVDRALLMQRAKDFSINTIGDQYLAYFGLSDALGTRV